MTFDLLTKTMHINEQRSEPWHVTLIDPGLETQTGGRLKRIMSHVRDEIAFCLTYGDAVADVNIADLIAFHSSHGKLATVLGVRPPPRFGSIQLQGDQVADFIEKPDGDGGWIDGGFFILSPAVANFIDGDDVVCERYPLQELARRGELKAMPELRVLDA